MSDRYEIYCESNIERSHTFTDSNIAQSMPLLWSSLLGFVAYSTSCLVGTSLRLSGWLSGYGQIAVIWK